VSTDLHRGPLNASQVEAGATLGAFGGWEMPISYPGGGVVAEHTAVREAVGVFDVTHLGKISIVGQGAAEFVNSCFTADLAKIHPVAVIIGKTLLLNYQKPNCAQCDKVRTYWHRTTL